MFRTIRLCYDPDAAAGAAPQVDVPGSTTVQVTTGDAPPAYTPPTLDMATALPPEFRNEPYFKGKDFVSIVKEHANLQKLIGQRPAGIPGADAPDTEWTKLADTLRPKDLTAYQFPETEFSKANKRSPELEKAVREIMAEAGVPAKLFPKAAAKVDAFLAETAKTSDTKREEARVAREKEFDTLLASTYGDKRTEVTERAKALMVESVPAELKESVTKALSNISNDALFALTAVLNGIHSKYIAEDSRPGAFSPSGADAASLQSEAEAIMRSPEYQDFRSPGYEAARAKVQELFGQVAKARK